MSETNLPTPTTTNETSDRYPSLAALRAAHGELVRRRRESGESPAIWDAVATFIQRGRETGALLDANEDRRIGQSLLDYWSNTLYRFGREPPDATLAEFDPMLAPELDDALCPYLGLDAFGETDHGVFFGRQRLVEEMIEQLGENRLLAVIGSSGSGKSSVVRAGLLPALKSGAMQGSQNWRYYPPMVPGSNPLANLTELLTLPEDAGGSDPWVLDQVDRFLQDANHLAHLFDQWGDEPVVLVIDQFEEVFTLCSDDRVRRAFIDNLLSLVQASGARHTVILTMRIDFEPYVARLPSLQPLFEKSQVRVSPLNAGELREAIAEPAELVGLKFEEGIVDGLIQDILGEPAALPLLQFTLLKLWENRERNRVTWEAYRRLGGARQALARSADEFYDGLIPEDQRAVKRILLRMVRPGEGLEVTSNRIRRATLYQAGEARDRVDRVLERLVEARLVHLTEGGSPQDAQVEVAHEALVRNWPRLVDWLEDEREAMRRRLRLTAAAEEWDNVGRDPGALLRGALLDEALRYPDLNELESAFVKASQTAIEAEQEKEIARQRQMARTQALAEAEKQRAEEQARASRRLRHALLGLAAVFIVAVFAAALASVQWSVAHNAQRAAEANEQIAVAERAIAATAKVEAEAQRDKAQRQSEISLAQSLAALAPRVHNDDELTTLLAVEAFHINRRVSGSAQWLIDSALRETLSKPHFSVVLRGYVDSVASVAFSPDGQTLASGSGDGTVRLWDLGNPAVGGHVLSGHMDWVRSVSFHPDGKTLASGSYDGTIRLWDVSAVLGAGLGEPAAEPRILSDHQDGVTSVAFSPDGQTLASGSFDGTVRLWDVSAVLSAGLGDPAVEPRVLSGHQDGVTSVAFSPDGKTLASGSYDGTVRVWDVSAALDTDPGDPAAKPRVLRGHEHGILDVAFRPDGKTLASGGYGGTVRLWDVSAALDTGLDDPAAELDVLKGHTSDIRSLAFSPDGRTLASGGGDRTVRLWDLSESLADSPESLVDSPESTAEPLVLRGHASGIWSVAFCPDGSALASGSGDWTVRLWNLGDPVAEPSMLHHGYEGGVISVAFSPDGQTLASGSHDWMVRLWDVSTVLGTGPDDPGERVRPAEPRVLHGHEDGVLSVAFSPNGKTLASGSFDGTIRLWDVSTVLGTGPGNLTTEPLVLRGHAQGVTSVAFSASGKTLASGSLDGTVRLWDVSTVLDTGLGDPAAEPIVLRGHEDIVWSLAFHPDREILASGSYDGAIRLWDISTVLDTGLGDPGAEPPVLYADGGSVWSLAFHPDGQMLASGSEDGTIRLWDISAVLDTGSGDLTTEPRVLRGHEDRVRSVAFSPGGQTLASSGDDRTVRLWEVLTVLDTDLGDPTTDPRVLRGHEDKVRSVAFNPDGRTLASGSEDGTVRLWVVSLEELVELGCRQVRRNLTPEEWRRYLPGQAHRKTCEQWPLKVEHTE